MSKRLTSTTRISSYTVECAPKKTTAGVCDIQPMGSAVAVFDGTAATVKRVVECFAAMSQGVALGFLREYGGDGIHRSGEQHERLVSEHQQHLDAMAEEDGEFDVEEGEYDFVALKSTRPLQHHRSSATTKLVASSAEFRRQLFLGSP